MCALARVYDVHDPIAYLWLSSVARFVYGFDRFAETDDDEDSAESIALAFAVSIATLHARDLFVLAPVQSFVAQSYPSFKRRFALAKPLYIGAAWACAISVVPRKMEHRAMNGSEFWGTLFLAAAVSNHADIRDMEDDAANGIHTVPVVHGRRFAVCASGVSAACAAACYFTPQGFRATTAKMFGRISPVQCSTPQECSLSRSPVHAKPSPNGAPEDAREEIQGRKTDGARRGCSVGTRTPSASIEAANRHCYYYYPTSTSVTSRPRRSRKPSSPTQRDAKWISRTRPLGRLFGFPRHLRSL